MTTSSYRVIRDQVHTDFARMQDVGIGGRPWLDPDVSRRAAAWALGRAEASDSSTAGSSCASRSESAWAPLAWLGSLATPAASRCRTAVRRSLPTARSGDRTQGAAAELLAATVRACRRKPV